MNRPLMLLLLPLVSSCRDAPTSPLVEPRPGVGNSSSNPYTAIDLGTLGGTQSYAFGINGDGQVIGVARTASHHDHAFLWSNGVMIDLTPDGATRSQPRGINQSGQVVGHAWDGSDDYLGPFHWDGSELVEIGLVGANDINDEGVIAGSVHDTEGEVAAASGEGHTNMECDGASGHGGVAAARPA